SEKREHISERYALRAVSSRIVRTGQDASSPSREIKRAIGLSRFQFRITAFVGSVESFSTKMNALFANKAETRDILLRNCGSAAAQLWTQLAKTARLLGIGVVATIQPPRRRSASIRSFGLFSRRAR